MRGKLGTAVKSFDRSSITRLMLRKAATHWVALVAWATTCFPMWLAKSMFDL